MTTQVIEDYAPESTVRIRKDDPVTRVPWVTELTAQVLFANAYIRTVGDVAALPTRHPGIARAFAQDANFKTWAQLFVLAQRVVDAPDGIAVRSTPPARTADTESGHSDPHPTAAATTAAAAVPAPSCRVM